MAGSFSNYTELALLDHVVGKTSHAVPTVFCGLCTADPLDAGVGSDCNECANANNYARIATAGLWEAAAAGAIQNASDITFAEANGSWGTVTHFALFDSGTYGAGNMLAHGDLSASKVIGSGDTPKFAAGDIDITLD